MQLPSFLPALPWKWIGVALAALLAVVAVIASIKAYGNARYEAGVVDTDIKWEAAARKLVEEGEAAEDAADTSAAEREEEFMVRMRSEKEKLDEAAADGSDPFDVLFGADGV